MKYLAIFLILVSLSTEAFAVKTPKVGAGVSIRTETGVAADAGAGTEALSCTSKMGEATAALGTLAGPRHDCEYEKRRTRIEHLEAKTCAGEFRWRKLCTSVRDNSLKLAGSTVLAVVSCYCVSQSRIFIDYMLTPALDPDTCPAIGAPPSASGAQSPADFAVGGAITAAVGSVIQDLAKALKECKVSELDAWTQIWEMLKLESKEHVKALPPDLRARIENLDSHIDRSLRSDQLATGKSTAADLIKAIKVRELWYLSLPQKPINIAHYDRDGKAELDEAVTRKIDALIGSYAPENRDELQGLVRKMRDNSILPPTRAMAYLYGPPGVGKTKFVENLGHALGLKVCVINLRNASTNEHFFFGTGNAQMGQFAEGTGAIGEIGKCFLEAGHTNPIIFFDEAGDYLSPSSEKGGDYHRQYFMASLKLLLNPDTKESILPGIGVKLDISRATFLFAGNDPLTDDALRRRMPQITFSRVTKEIKTKVATEIFDKTFAGIRSVLRGDLVDPVEAEARKHFQFLIDTDVKMHPGAAIIQTVVVDFINYVRESLRTRGTITETEAHEYILRLNSNATTAGESSSGAGGVTAH